MKESSKEILVGVEYFNGWWKNSPKWITDGVDWRPQYPSRIPLLGEVNSQETMDKEIKAASEYGVDFFSILWYYHGNAMDKTDMDHQQINDAVKFFTNSPFTGRMKFMIELCNHAPFAIITDEDWDKCMDVCISAMKHPDYLRIDGRAALKIHNGHQFFNDNSSSIPRSKQILQRIRRKARDEGAGELLIALGTYGTNPVDGQHIFMQMGEVDATMQYMDTTELPQREEDYPYEELTAFAKKFRAIRENDAINWVPYFPAGWNPKPWRDPRPSFGLPSREQWESALQDIKTDLVQSSNLGFPKKDGATQKAFTIYAWNEFGEGGILAPTKGEQYMKLEVIREVFGN